MRRLKKNSRRPLRLRRNRSALSPAEAKAKRAAYALKRKSARASLLSLATKQRMRKGKSVGGRSVLTTKSGKPSLAKALNHIVTLTNAIARLRSVKRSKRPSVGSNQAVKENGLFEVRFYLSSEGERPKPFKNGSGLPMKLGPFTSVRSAATEAKSALRAVFGSGIPISELTLEGWDTAKPIRKNPKRRIPLRKNRGSYEALERVDRKVLNYLHPSLYQGQGEDKPMLQAQIFKIGGAADRHEFLVGSGEDAYKYNPRRRTKRARKILCVRNPLVKFQSRGGLKSFNADYTGKDKGTYATRLRKKLVRKSLKSLRRRGTRDSVSATKFRLYTRVAGQKLPRYVKTVTRNAPISVAGLRKALKLGVGITIYPVSNVTLPAGFKIKSKRVVRSGKKHTVFRLSAPRRKAVSVKANPRRRVVRRKVGVLRRNSAYRLNRKRKNPSCAFNVFKGTKKIDVVMADCRDSAADVKRSLVNHDGYDSSIRVTKARKAKK